MVRPHPVYGPAIGGGAMVGRTVRRRRDDATGVVRVQRLRSLIVWCEDQRRNLTFRDGTYDVILLDTDHEAV